MSYTANTSLAAAVTPNVQVTSSAALTPYATPVNFRFPQQVIRTVASAQSDTLPVISTLNGLKYLYIVTNEGPAALTIQAGAGNTILGQASITINALDSLTLYPESAADWAAQ